MTKRHKCSECGAKRKEELMQPILTYRNEHKTNRFNIPMWRCKRCPDGWGKNYNTHGGARPGAGRPKKSEV